MDDSLELQIRRDRVPNADGWRLDVKRTVAPRCFDPRRRPVLLVPGYGMNTFILGYHPRGLSLEAYLARAGLEVFSANLRRQGDSERAGGSDRYGLKELGLVDLPAVVEHVLARTATSQRRVDLVGCSLGATLAYIYLALAPGAAERVGALVSFGGALRLVDPHPAVKALFASETLAGAVPLVGIRPLARTVLPLLARAPSLLSIYLHPEICDLSKPSELARTVDTPNRHVNREMARWVRDGDVSIDGKSLTAEFVAKVRAPLLSIVANGDGIVTPASARSAHEHGRMAVKELLEVGTASVPMAHADLFISDHAQDWVFAPMTRWLASVDGAVATGQDGEAATVPRALT